MAVGGDVILKQMVETSAESFLRWLKLPFTEPPELIDTTVPITQIEPDRVILVPGPTPWLLHLEFQASHDAALPERLLRYNAVLTHRHSFATITVLVLLRPEADAPRLRQPLAWRTPFDHVSVALNAVIVRLWEAPVEDLLGGDATLAPLAALSHYGAREAPEIFNLIQSRIASEEPHVSSFLALATYTLAGLRYSPAELATFWQGVRGMRESSTYQAILEEGRSEGRSEGRLAGQLEGRLAEGKSILFLIGKGRFGVPDDATRQFVETIDDVKTLERLAGRLLSVASWEELINEDSPNRDNGRPINDRSGS